jgi:8-oxo-dGTP diphosphatase
LRHSGWWEFPGGSIELGESPEGCLKRELKEEFQIDVSVGAFFAANIHQYQRNEVRLMAYWVKWLDGHITPSDHDQIAWASPQQLPDYELLPADIPFARQLAELDPAAFDRFAASCR